MTALDLLIVNGRIATCDGPPDADPRTRLGILDRGHVAIRDGRIVDVGTDRPHGVAAAQTLDAAGGLVMPGLVDPHTHLVFAGSRVDEMARKMAGEDYRRIAAEGGGIAATVHATRATDQGALAIAAGQRARAMRAYGVTTVEVKSGYGLDLETELRLLRVGRQLEEDGIVRTSTTFLGAHAMPPDWHGDRADYLSLVIEQMLPAVAQARLASSCDVYIDEGAFTLAEGRRVLEAARRLGLGLRAHIGQFVDLGGPSLLAELGALSGDHLEAVCDAGARAMARAGVVGVLLPGAWRTLRQTPPDVGRLRAAGVSLAVGTDCNPGTSPCLDLPLAAGLAVRDAGLTMEEAILGVTAVAAAALGRTDVGRIRRGAWADLAIFGHDDPRALCYGLGGVRARTVLRAGSPVEGDPGAPVW